MRGDNRPHGERSVAIADRGHVPFAVIAVLLLVSSVATIAILQQRSEPRIDREAQILMDRTETAAQSELRTGVLAATHQAGAAPINSTEGGDVDTITSASHQTEAFEQYVKLLVYLEASDRLPAAGQSTGSGTASTVSLAPVTTDPDDGERSPDEAIEQVDLEIGAFDDGVEDGTVNATIHGVEFDGHVEGEPIPNETRSISVTVGSPVFELNEKMTEYESELNRGFFESDGMSDPTSLDGLGQELAARQYAITYMKASWNRFGTSTSDPSDHDFEETVGTDHTEVLANHAIYSVQEDTFGTRDPYADRQMRPQYLCMTLDFATTIGDVDLEMDLNDIVPSENVSFSEDLDDHIEQMNESESTEDGPDDVLIGVNEELDFEEELCEDGGLLNDWIFGDEATEDLPEVPPLSELIQDGTDSMGVGEQEIELPVETLATASYEEYRLGGQDPVTYLEDNQSDMEGQIEGAGAGVDDDYSDSLPVDGGEEYTGSTHDIRDELFELDVSLGGDSAAGSLPSPSAPSGDGWMRISTSESVRDVSVDDVTHEPTTGGAAYDREIHTLEADATVDVQVSHDYVRVVDNETQTTTQTARDDVDVSVDATIDAEYGFEDGGVYYEAFDEFQVEPDPIETDYGTHENVTFQPGFENALLELTSATSYGSAESDISDQLESDLEESDPDSLASTAEESVIEDHHAALESDEVVPNERTALSESLDDELEDVHENFLDDWAEDPLRIQINELTDDESPPERIKEHIQDEYEDEYVDDGPYETPESKAKQQIRKAYFDRLYYWLEAFDDEYSGQMDDFNDEIDDHTGDGVDGMNDVLGYVQGVANADFDPDPADLEGSPVHDDAQYEVSGAPTYLTATEVEREDVSAVRDEHETIMDTDSDVDHDPMAIQTHNRVPWPGTPALFYLPSKWYVTLNFWNVEVQGEYARLEVSSTIGDPADSDRLTYVAEHSPVTVELDDGESVTVGKNEAVDFETETEVIVIMPGAVVQRGGPVPAVADGDLQSDGTTYCSETWDEVGPDADVDHIDCNNL